jgi:hypothetical protein
LRGPHMSRWIAALAVPMVIAAVAMLGTSSAAPASSRSEAELPIAQIVAVAHDTLCGLRGPGVKTASVVATTKAAAENWIGPGVPAGPSNPMAYLIVLDGAYPCQVASFAPGAQTPTGTYAHFVWVPGQGVSDVGFPQRLPHGLGTIGHVFRLRLIAPRVPAKALALQPGLGIGPVRLGARLTELDRRIGPALGPGQWPGQWAFGPIQVDTQASRDGRVVELLVNSPQATLDGRPLGEGYHRLRHEFGGWRSLDCGSGLRVLSLDGAGGISTHLEFAGDTFGLAWIGTARPGECLAPFPGL